MESWYVQRAAFVSPSLAVSSLSYFGSVATVPSFPSRQRLASLNRVESVFDATCCVLETSASAPDSTTGCNWRYESVEMLREIDNKGELTIVDIHFIV